jgi:carbonic anhydrase/acetyltransferase-like protein (isoleucine patch superfamily)
MSLYALEKAEPSLPSDNSCWVAPTAALMGKIELQTGVSVWFGAVLRGDIELILVGENSNIQDGCMLHTDFGCPLTIGRFCTIGHHAVLHGCTIGDNSLIGIGATVLNRARIGKNCIVGAHALVSEGKVIPDNSLVLGVPGKVVREVTPEDVVNLTEQAKYYVENGKKFAKNLTLLS